jgi:hypothetical protein
VREAMIGPRLGAGREAEVYSWGADAVIKLYRPGYLGHRAESLALAQLDGHGVAPGLIDIVDHDGRTGLVLERLRGPDMLSLLERRPWRMLGLARALAGAHRGIHEVAAPPELPDLRDRLAAGVERAELSPHLRGFALGILDGLPSGDRLCHGDLHPGNALVVADRAAVIDWGNASRGVPAADHARTLLLLRWADPLPGTSVVFRGVMAAGRSVFAGAYARAYRRDTHAMPQVGSWLTVHIAARLAEGLDVERPMLIDLLDRAWRNSTP